MAKPFVQNSADADQVKGARLKEKFKNEREDLDIVEVLSTLPGRRFVWRYLAKCGVFKSSYSHSGSEVYFNEGRRDIGLALLGDIMRASPQSYIQMMKEEEQNAVE